MGVLSTITGTSGLGYWLGAIGVAAVVSGGLGYWQGSSQAETIMADAVASAYDNGTAAQKKYDAGVYAKDKADFLKRQAADKGRDDKLHQIEETLPTIVPPVAACTVSADAIRKLNEVAQ